MNAREKRLLIALEAELIAGGDGWMKGAPHGIGARTIASLVAAGLIWQDGRKLKITPLGVQRRLEMLD